MRKPIALLCRLVRYSLHTLFWYRHTTWLYSLGNCRTMSWTIINNKQIYSPRLYKYRDSYVLYIPTVHAFGSVFLTHTLLVQTHTWRFCPWYFHVGKLKCLVGISNLKRQITLFVNWFFSLIGFVWIYTKSHRKKVSGKKIWK